MWNALKRSEIGRRMPGLELAAEVLVGGDGVLNKSNKTAPERITQKNGYDRQILVTVSRKIGGKECRIIPGFLTA